MLKFELHAMEIEKNFQPWVNLEAFPQNADYSLEQAFADSSTTLFFVYATARPPFRSFGKSSEQFRDPNDKYFIIYFIVFIFVLFE
jgi:hypothetical protein